MKGNINNLQRSDLSKVQLTIVIDFIYSNDNDEEHVMHSKAGNMRIMTCDIVKVLRTAPTRMFAVIPTASHRMFESNSSFRVK